MNQSNIRQRQDEYSGQMAGSAEYWRALRATERGDTTMFRFFSQIQDTLQFGKRTVTQPRLKAHFTSGCVVMADGGWFCANMKITRDVALKIMATLATKIPDLIVEDLEGNRLTA